MTKAGIRAIRTNDVTKILQSEIRFGFKRFAHGLTMRTEDFWFATGTMVLGTDVAETATLLDQLLDHAGGNAEAAGDRFPRYVTLTASSEDSLAEIEGESGREPIMAPVVQTATVLSGML